MANAGHLAVLQQGPQVWNAWRKEHPDIVPDLSWADLQLLNLGRINFAGAHLRAAKFQNAILTNGIFWKADLAEAELHEADLREANLRKANLFDAKLTGADLRGANLTGALLVDTDLQTADLTGCFVYGCSVWDVKLEGAIQRDLVIIDKHSSSHEWKPEELTDSLLTVDDLEVAQFIYLLLHNEKIGNVIDTIGKKGVLILGRFTKERKAVLDAIRERLRELGFVPMMFDFKKPTQRDFTETIKTLAGMSRFIIADITNPKSSPLELQATMPDYMIPFVPIIHETEKPFAMFRDLKQKYGEWVLDVLAYDSVDGLLRVLDKAVVKPALEAGQKLLLKKAEQIRVRHVHDYV